MRCTRRRLALSGAHDHSPRVFELCSVTLIAKPRPPSVVRRNTFPRLPPSDLSSLSFECAPAAPLAGSVPWPNGPGSRFSVRMRNRYLQEQVKPPRDPGFSGFISIYGGTQRPPAATCESCVAVVGFAEFFSDLRRDFQTRDFDKALLLREIRESARSVGLSCSVRPEVFHARYGSPHPKVLKAVGARAAR